MSKKLWILALGLALSGGYVAGHYGLISAANAGPRPQGESAETKRSRARKRARRRAKQEDDFKEKVREAVAKELADLAKLKQEFANHHHTFTETSQGLATMATIDNCPDCLIPFVSPNNARNSSTVQTSGPK